MLTKEFIKNINPKQNPYNTKYSEGTYKFFNKYKSKDLKIYWNKRSRFDGKITEFNAENISFYPTQIYFMYEELGDLYGTTWSQVMQNKYKVSDYTHWDRNDFQDITEWFCNTYLKIGRCIFDNEHTNFLLGQNHGYVGDEERFEIIDEVKKCKWCGKAIE